jgi:hypothetical protein
LGVVEARGPGYSATDFDQLLGAFYRPCLVRPNSRFTMMPPRKANPRAEYRLSEIQRVNSSVSLAEKFPKLKTLRVDLVYFDPDGLSKTGELRYKVNVQHAKSVFSFVCQSGECLAGDFDLSDAVTKAVTGRRKIAEGEIRCQGTRAKPKEGKRPCHNLLRYKLTLGYV